MFELDKDAVFQVVNNEGLAVFSKHALAKRDAKQSSLCPEKIKAAQANRDFVNSLLG